MEWTEFERATLQDKYLEWAEPRNKFKDFALGFSTGVVFLVLGYLTFYLFFQ